MAKCRCNLTSIDIDYRTSGGHGRGTSSHINKLIKTNRLSKNVLIFSTRGRFSTFFIGRVGLNSAFQVHDFIRISETFQPFYAGEEGDFSTWTGTLTVEFVHCRILLIVPGKTLKIDDLIECITSVFICELRMVSGYLL